MFKLNLTECTNIDVMYVHARQQLFQNKWLMLHFSQSRRMILRHVCVLLFLLKTILSNDRILHRDKRALLVFPRGGAFKLVLGFAIPVKLGTKQSMAIGWNLQFQYVPAQNVTQLHSLPILSRRSRTKREQQSQSDRALAYLGFESILNRQGLDGRQCLLRSICENALLSTFEEANGLYGQLIHIALTPDYGDGEIEPDLDPVYLEAQKAGEFGVDCQTLFTECSHGLLNLFTILETEY